MALSCVVGFLDKYTVQGVGLGLGLRNRIDDGFGFGKTVRQRAHGRSSGPHCLSLSCVSPQPLLEGPNTPRSLSLSLTWTEVHGCLGLEACGIRSF